MNFNKDYIVLYVEKIEKDISLLCGLICWVLIYKVINNVNV